MEECSFCQIDESNIVLETEYSICSCYSNSLKAEHLVVSAKRHVERLSDLTESEVKDLFLLAHRVSKVIGGMLQLEKLYILHIGDKERHFHIHLIPRLQNEEKLGPFIFGVNGWKSKVKQEIGALELMEFRNNFKARLRSLRHD